MKAHGVVRTGEDDPFDALAARRLEDIVTAFDIQRQHLVPCGLRGRTGEVHDAVYPRHRTFQRGHVAYVRREKFFTRRGGAQRSDIEKSNKRIAAAQTVT